MKINLFARKSFLLFWGFLWEASYLHYLSQSLWFSMEGTISGVHACYLWGTDSGYCSTETLDSIWRAENMPYCGNRVVYPACLPKPQTMPPSREFPDGRWFNHTVLTKDIWVADKCETHIAERRALENNGTLRRKNENEYGESGRIKRRFFKRPDCMNAFRNMFCYINFPRCDPDRDITLPTCRSVCENFFKSCLYAKDLWRCGKSKYFNGYFPEKPTTASDGNLTYLRDYFPGQPWRENKFNRKGSDLPVCTPAIRGAASSRYSDAMVPWVSSCTLAIASLVMPWV